MGRNYNEIENALSKRYNGLLLAVTSPDAVKRAETVNTEYKEKKENGFFDFFRRPAMQFAGVILAAVLVCGGTYLGIMKLNSLNSGNTPDTSASTAAETTGAEDTVRRMIIKAKTYVFGEETNNIDLNGSEREFEVVVSFENVSDLKSASLKISWEKPGLTLKNAEYMVNGLTNTPDKPWSEVQNSYVFNWLALDAKDEIKSRTKFVKLTFRGSDDIKPGTVVIKIEPDQSNIFDSDSNDVPYTLESETVYFDFLHYTLPDTADHSTKEPDPDPDTYYPEYLIVSDDNEEIQVKAYEESADGATDVSVLRYDGSKIKPEFSGITMIEGITVEKIGIKADGVPGDYYENYINDYLETKNTGVYRFVVSYEITNNGISERWEYPFDVEVWIKSDTTDPDPETTTVEETTTAPETTVPEETTAPEETTTAEETTTVETTTEEKGREFKSVQPTHETPDFIENPTTLYQATPYFPSGSGVRPNECQYIIFRIFDCGYEQFEKVLALEGKKLSDGIDTAYIRENMAAGKLKFWICDLDGNKIDYVFANRNGFVGFIMYPGEYRIMYEDDGTFKTNFSTVVKVEKTTGGTSYKFYDNHNESMYSAYVCIYNYRRYKPVTITVTDKDTGKPIKDVNIGYQIQYLNDAFECVKTDKNGMLKFDSIFDIMIEQNPEGINSWHSDIMLYFEKDGYDRLGTRTDNVKETSFEVKLHKTEYIEYTIKVQNKETGEPIKGARLERNSTIHGDFTIEESGEDGILKGLLPSYDLTDLYGEPAANTNVTVTYICETARDNNQAETSVPLNRGTYDFTLLFTNVNTRLPEGEFEFVPFW